MMGSEAAYTFLLASDCATVICRLGSGTCIMCGGKGEGGGWVGGNTSAASQLVRDQDADSAGQRASARERARVVRKATN